MGDFFGHKLLCVWKLAWVEENLRILAREPAKVRITVGASR
jgi:hypothetical protein